MTHDHAKLAKHIVEGTSEETKEYAAKFGVLKPPVPGEKLPAKTKPAVFAHKREDGLKVSLGDLLKKALK